MKQIKDDFTVRHNGPSSTEAQEMLKAVGVSSFEELIDKTIPKAIRFSSPLDLPEGMPEGAYLDHIKTLFSKNKLFKSYIGMGYYNTYTPAVILRNIFENPGWYTSYTPYQAEISQGRLEALLNYQTMVSSLTGMPIANASLLDEGTAAGEMMLMFFNSRSREAVKNNVNKYFVSEDIFAPTLGVMKTIAAAQDIELVIGKADQITIDATFFGAMLQYPNSWGAIHDYRNFVAKAHENNIFVGVATDLLALTLLTPPGEWGADCVMGSTQRFGIPMGFGSPAAGFFACKEDFKRQMPGRIIGLTIDAEGNSAYRMALQMREQHIKRERATSNICTASALTAIMAGFYAMWHGAVGLKDKATKINVLAGILTEEAAHYGYRQHNEHYFDTVCFEAPSTDTYTKVKLLAEKKAVNFNYWGDDCNCFTVALDETITLNEINDILSIFAEAAQKEFTAHICQGDCEIKLNIPTALIRTSEFLTSDVFFKYHSETEMMRYMKRLEVKDLSLNRAMIPLGSCTMKLNAAAEMLPLSWPEACGIHPYVPADQAQGYIEMIQEMGEWLCKITGFKAISFQPNSGAAGEYAGLMVIRNYHHSRGEAHRNICLIPASAHGTNPASSAKAGNKIVVVKSTDQGEIDIEDLKAKAAEYSANLSCLMITYPSTHGVFEEAILDIIQIIHQHGGLVYMDGANMNAQVGITSPGFMGADVCHLNLHKTFAMPHGGGGPGVGPIAVADHLVAYLPKHECVNIGGEKGSQVASAPYGSAYLLPITYGYLKMLGGPGLAEATRYAILNANYLRVRLEKDYKILYTGKQGMCAHEMILDCNEFEKFGVKVGDIAKRLMDYGFHAPTVAFPVHGTLMVEPTESEPLSELNRLVDALISIRQEIREVEEGKADKENNVIVKAPHTMGVVCADTWERPYSRQKAAFPMKHTEKYWPTVSKIDDAYGDRNLVCCLQ